MYWFRQGLNPENDSVRAVTGFYTNNSTLAIYLLLQLSSNELGAGPTRHKRNQPLRKAFELERPLITDKHTEILDSSVGEDEAIHKSCMWCTT